MKQGFTLLELLVALAVLGLITIMLMSATRYGIQVWGRTDTLAATAGELALSRTILARDLGDALPVWRPNVNGTARIEFDGGPTQLTFLAPAPDSMGHAGLLRYTLSAQGRRLTLSGPRELGIGNPPPASVLVDRAARIEIDYWGSAMEGGLPAWQAVWRDRAELPSLIRVRVTFPPDDGRRWPELVVAPRIAFDGSCVYDPLSFHCRGR